jgi:putative effector of murein hydrolase
MLLIAYAVALWLALWFSVYWLVWVLVALGIGIGIPILLLTGISFALWIHGKARANDLEVGPEAIEGCLVVFFAVLEVLFKW